MQFSTISLIGLGYIGLPTAALLASRMGNVVGVDVNCDVVESITNGNVKTLEPGLTELLAQVSGSALRAVTKPEAADAFIIAVPTPITDDHKPDISYVRSAALSLAPVLRTGNLIILESTSPVGTTEQMAQWLAEARPDLSFPQQAGDGADVQIAYCPERILPGKMLEELVHNDRIVGGLTRTASDMAAALYRLFVEGEIHITSVRTAELCKLAENSFRDVNIAYANELSMICDKLDIDVEELISLANHHPRVNILQPGCGVGGHCIPVDPWFIVDSAPEEARLIRTAREVNDSKPDWMVNKIKQTITVYLKEHPEKQIKDVSIACYGISYKEGTNDLRNSPALKIVQKLDAIGCQLFVIDSNMLEYTEELGEIRKWLVQSDTEKISADIQCPLVWHKSKNDS
ncbi:UDP-N-acetyl-D-mannosamine dehydrogenase [Desulfovibrio piger]|uniref:UDP-N-acetyl-D-mannosamine dehydrogenase n=1 Tax=Desulfovibrio piger TaxID=901 RepID=UPI00307D53AD